MKLILSSFFIYLFFFCTPAFCEKFYKQYTVKVSGVKIGMLYWKIEIEKNSYHNLIFLKNEGLLSALYSFEGEYLSKGTIDNNILKPTEYVHSWKTSKTVKNMRLVFNKNKLELLEQKPTETEVLRIDIFNIKKIKDPLTSFLEIIIGAKKSLVLDGRRLYTMNANYTDGGKKTVIDITKYTNLWADHKKNKFEKITFEKENFEFLPSKILIYFDKRIFRLESS